MTWPNSKGHPLLFLVLVAVLGHADSLDLRRALIVSPPVRSKPLAMAIDMLADEVEKRSHIRWPDTNAWPGAASPVIAVSAQSEIAQFEGPYASDLRLQSSQAGAEGYRIRVLRGRGEPVVCVIGNDTRGVLFGVGRLLRELRMQPATVTLAHDLNVTSAPRYRLRGHQLGYRPKCNSYDAWDLPTWEQYYRDLIVFGWNAVELIPPRSDDDPDSPHFPRPPMEMMVGMSQLAAAYDLEVWIWYPALDKDYTDPATVESALAEWDAAFDRLPRVDAVFVPGGDPGHTPPGALMALLEKQTQNLRRHHPGAQMWVSPQGFNQAWLEEFIGILNHDSPSWLTGVVFGPQVRISLPRLRELVPAQYPIRHYPDITHSRQCQYPVPDWDTAYAVAEARECINPRPEAEAVLFRQLQPHTIGFLTYSEGCNDDVNKCVWSALGWDPDAAVVDILRAYGRYFIGERYAEPFAQGLLALERNWEGPLLANESVFTTLAQFQSMEQTASPADLRNWRFQQALFRAYADAYVRQRLLHETDLEQRAMECLRGAPDDGTLAALQSAETTLDRAVTQPVAGHLRARLGELGEALFQTIGMQLSVAKYRAIAPDRGATLDTLDFPLNDRLWLKARFALIRQSASEAERLRAIESITQWTNPGPGGFYDDLGNSASQPHVVRGAGFRNDPGGYQSSRVGFEEDLVADAPDEKLGVPRRRSWIDHAETLYDAPLQMRYTGLEPNAPYTLRVAYVGDNPRRKIRLVANDRIEIHPLMPKPVPFRILEFSIPSDATALGQLTLSWYGEPGLGGNGRGCQVSEVWLMRAQVPASPSPGSRNP